MGSHYLLCIRVVHKQSTDYHDSHSNNNSAHDDYNLIYKLHFVHTVFGHILQRSFDSHMHELVGNHYLHGNQLE